VFPARAGLSRGDAQILFEARRRAAFSGYAWVGAEHLSSARSDQDGQNGLVIVVLEPAHVEGCLDVIRSVPEWFGYEGAVEAVATALGSQEGFVALEGSVVAGFVTIEPAFDESLEITYLAVHADHRRSGFGGLLVHAVAELARARDIPSVCLLTLGPSAGSTHQAETISFYRAIGFWRAKEFYLRTWGGAPTLLMVAPVDNLL
jgi:ribosomal protein S18 acetylase RimI-like enzyme